MKHRETRPCSPAAAGAVRLLAASAPAKAGFSNYYSLVRVQRVKVGDGSMTVDAPRP